MNIDLIEIIPRISTNKKKKIHISLIRANIKHISQHFLKNKMYRFYSDCKINIKECLKV